MQKFTTDWLVVCGQLRTVFAEAIEFMDTSIKQGADPASVALETLNEVRLAFAAIEADQTEGH